MQFTFFFFRDQKLFFFPLRAFFLNSHIISKKRLNTSQHLPPLEIWTFWTLFTVILRKSRMKSAEKKSPYSNWSTQCYSLKRWIAWWILNLIFYTVQKERQDSNKTSSLTIYLIIKNPHQYCWCNACFFTKNIYGKANYTTRTHWRINIDCS